MNVEVKVKVYPIDSIETVKNRVTYLIKGSPKLTIIDESSLENITETLNKLKSGNISKNYEEVTLTVKDVLLYLKKSKPDTLPNLEGISLLFKSGTENKPISRTYLLNIWMAYNKYYITDRGTLLPESGAMLRFTIETMMISLPEVIEDTDIGFNIVQGKITQREYDNMVRDLGTFKTDLENSFKKFYTKQGEILSTLNKVYSQEVIPGTDFQVEGITSNLWINLDIPILTIFNYLKLEKYAPFACIRNFYKIYQGYIPTELITLDNDIILKVSNVKEGEGKSSTLGIPKDKFLKDTSISSEEGKLKINIDYSIAERFLPKDEFISRILSVIDLHGDSLKISREEEESLSGVIYFKDQWLDKYVFADLILNNEIFSLFLSSNENTKLVKKKSQSYARFLFLGDPSKRVQLTFSNKIAEDNRIFPPETKYLRMKISKIRDKTDIYIFYNIISRLLSLYNSLETSIVTEYKKFIPSFTLQEVKPVDVKELRLKHIAPELFVKNYSTTCPLNRLPTVISREEYDSLPEERRLVFPRTPDEGIQRYLKCDHKLSRYPGLKKNPLSNRDKYKCVPCCYTEPQKDTKLFKKCYLPGTGDFSRTQQTLLLTGKTATSRGFGTLGNTLIKLFNLIDSNGEYLRKGTARSSSSFIECVLDGLGLLHTSNDKERVKLCEEVREELSIWEGLPVGRQEMYDMSIDDIRGELEDVDTFLDPRKYVSILEEKFNCNIFLFNDEKGGQMITGNYSQAYLRYESKTSKSPNYILVYINRGTVAEALEYPQCEIITRKDPTGKMISSFSKENVVISELGKVHQSLIEGYILSEKVGVYPDIAGLLFEEGMDIVSQKIDSYGKTREIFIKLNGKGLKIECDPIPPIPIPEGEIPHESWNKEDISFLMKIISNPQGEGNFLTGTISIQDYMKVNITVKTGDVIETFNGGPINNIDYSYSLIDIFNIKKKMNKYVLEFFFKYFSEYLHKKNITLEKLNTKEIDDVILSFIKDTIKVSPNVEKEIKPGVYFPKDFNDNFILKDGGKLVIPSDDYLKRLIFTLKLRIKMEAKVVSEFYKRVTFRSIYTEITDFNVYPNQIIIMGESRVNALFKDVLRGNCIYPNVNPDISTPYFFSNPLIKNGRVFLIQNVENISQAIFIHRNWIENGFNNLGLGKVPNLKRTPFTLWNIVSNDKVNKFAVNEGNDDSYKKINILGFLSDDGKKTFAILLDI